MEKTVVEQEIKKTTIEADGMELTFYTTRKDTGMHHLFNEMFEVDAYGLKKIRFKKGDIVVDIGANMGLFSIYLAKKYPDIIIYAFEPSLVNYGLFLKNIKENNVANIKAYRLVVQGQTAAEVVFTYVPDSPASSSTYLDGGIPEKVGAISFDDIVIKHGLLKIRFLKMDCEGSEYSIVRDSQKLTNDIIENVAVEIHNIPNENRYELIRVISQKLKKRKINYMFYPVVWGRNRQEVANRILGKIGLLLEKIAPVAYRKIKRVKDVRMPPKWKEIRLG